MAVQMELSRILIRELNDYQIIELREMGENGESGEGGGSGGNGGERSFPIVIGLAEAQSIERRLKGIAPKRPGTHDLLGSVIETLGGELQSITICDLADHTFFATLDVRKESGELVRIDSRPSDAIAIGIFNSVPIYVEEHVLEAATRDEG